LADERLELAFRQQKSATYGVRVEVREVARG
jgi:hypothetical protein